mmetsp:Transcript_29826/g.91324  ORF Transcript_29826/g.91324 Transcript_29826/m.91324 type:complete len:218 (+) Transcript_29826:3096-3749(+)
MAVRESRPWSRSGSASLMASGSSTNPPHMSRTLVTTFDGEGVDVPGVAAAVDAGVQGAQGSATRFGKTGHAAARTSVSERAVAETTAWAMVPEAPSDETPPDTFCGCCCCWSKKTGARQTGTGSVAARANTSPRPSLTAVLTRLRAPFGAASRFRSASIAAKRPMAPATHSPWPKVDLAPDRGRAPSSFGSWDLARNLARAPTSMGSPSGVAVPWAS